ncbi:hypothetical phage protein [Streptococcus uberis 0140J]|uniref:Hypothetical phage protein n=1 Tax=Streptococcus uberis (strain ATCC BAA-854 / 0140J) TaxID=218495 RepID=B9DWB3_STRU0|nr:hypothetical phage protein [Streptococcus uberis 0140J]
MAVIIFYIRTQYHFLDYVNGITRNLVQNNRKSNIKISFDMVIFVNRLIHFSQVFLNRTPSEPRSFRKIIETL